MVEVLVPVRSGENEELRFAMRSWDKRILGSRINAIVVGGKPAWCKPTLFIEGNPYENSQANLLANLIVGLEKCKDDSVVIMNDDFFQIDYFIPENFIATYRKSLPDHIRELSLQKGSWWEKSITLTNDWVDEKLGAKNPGLSFEVHRPLVVERVAMLDCLQKIVEEFPLESTKTFPQWRSVYGNFMVAKKKLKAFEQQDSKVFKGKSVFGGSFSTDDLTFKSVTPVLAQLFPDASKWEDVNLIPKESTPTLDGKTITAIKRFLISQTGLKLKLDGKFDESTREAVKVFQRRERLVVNGSWTTRTAQVARELGFSEKFFEKSF